MIRKIPKYILVPLVVALLICSSLIVYAYEPYSITFNTTNNNVVPVSSLAWGSPIGTSATNSTPAYPTVTSKWNTPRTEGTSPHLGVDLSAIVGIRLLAVHNGTMGSLGTDTFKTTKFVIKSDISSDLSCHYVHIQAAYSGDYYKGEVVGLSGTAGTAYPHLHFGAHDSTGKSYRTETLYRGVANWDYGKKLDAFSSVQWLNGNTVNITAYYLTGSSPYSDQTPSEVKIFHRKSGTSIWTDGGSMTSATNKQYTYSFSGKYPSGTAIEWTVRMKRPNVTNVSTWIPSKYYTPNDDPNATANKYAFYTNTLM